MTNNRQLLKGAGIIGAVAIMLALFFGNFSFDIAKIKCFDLKSMHSIAATTSDDQVKRDMEQQIAACEGKDLDNPPADANPSNGSSASPSATATATPKAKHWYDPFDPSAEQFYANWPAKYKSSVNAFGTEPLHPDLQGLEMEQLNADQAFMEQEYVVHRDRMQTASAMVYLGLSDKSVNDLTREYVEDRALWDHDKRVVTETLAEMDRRVEDKGAGTKVTTLRALSGADDDVPIVDSITVTYLYATRWVVYTDSNGKEYWFRLTCKFQPWLVTETQQALVSTPESPRQIPPAPPTRPGIVRTPEGTPVPLVDACRQVNGEWTVVRNVERKAGDLPVDSPKCKTSPTPTPTGTPTTTPTGTPTSTPTGTPTTTPTGTPTSTPTSTPTTTTPTTDIPKDDEDSVDPPADRDPAPAPNPDEGEDTPRPDPAEPADPGTAPGSGTTDPAPDSSPAPPAPEEPAPSAPNAPDPTAPGDEDIDPDG